MRIFFTVKNLTQIFDVKPETVYHWIKTGQLKASMVSKIRGYSVARNDLKKFVRAHPMYRIDMIRYLKSELDEMKNSTVYDETYDLISEISKDITELMRRKNDC